MNKIAKINSLLILVVGIAAGANASSFTPFASEGVDNSSVLLAAHNLQCGGCQGIMNFRLAREFRDGQYTGQMRYEYRCNAVTGLSAPKARYTNWNDEGGGNTAYLDRHDVSCAPGEIINQFKLVRRFNNTIPTGDFRYEYRCTDIGSQNHTLHETEFNDEGGGRNIYLERHNVSCPDGTALNSFRLVRDETQTQYKYVYTCAQIPPNYSKALGLANLNNTCFANSVHKLLMATSDLDRDRSAIQTPLKLSFFTFLEKLKLHNQILELVPDAAFDSDDRFRAELSDFYDELQKVSENISIFYPSRIRQHQVDAQDYFHRLVELLDLQETLSGFRQSFQITLTSGHKNAVRTDHGQRLSLSLFILDDEINSVTDALRAYFEPAPFSFPNLIENDLTGNLEEGAVRQYLTLDPGHPLPRQVFVALNRFSLDGRKSNKRIRLDEQITLDFHSGNLNSSTSKRYRLKAVSIHHGSLNGGHYTAYTLDTQNNWLRHNDSVVTPVAAHERAVAEEDMHNYGYMMLYEESERSTA